MNNETKQRLPFWLKLMYGSGDFGIASVGVLRALFLAIYLTDVVGLEPRLASYGALIGFIWDAVNDPIVGVLTDRLRTRWGRRRPFLLWFAVPFGLSFIILWSAPDWDSQVALLTYVTLSFMLADTLQTLISVPYLSLTPELTPDYDERTNLTSFRSFFQLAGALIVSVAAPNVISAVIAAGGTQQQGLMLVGAIFGGIGAVPLILIGLFIRENPSPEQTESMPVLEMLRMTWRNIPFRYGVAIYVFNWTASDMINVAFPYFLLYWVAQGDLLAKVGGFDYKSAFFGVLLAVAIAAIPFWLWLAQKMNKRNAYILGMMLWVVMQVLIYTVPQQGILYLLLIAALIGMGVSAAYTLPDSLFADIIEWDELRTRRRHEGIYYGIRALIRKLTGALAIFITLQALGGSGYQQPINEIPQLQSASTLTMIRLLVSPFGAVMLSGTIIFAWLFPLSRERYARMQKLLERRRARMAK